VSDVNLTRRSETAGGDTAFLRDIIRRLEREKEQEQERHDRIVAKLFGELDVKNKQISAWDELTQGLTKALATGQIAPNLGLLVAGVQSDKPRVNETGSAAQRRDPQNATVISATPAPATNRSKAGEEGTAMPSKRPARRKAKSSTLKTAAEKPVARNQLTKTALPRKHKWYDLPTVRRIFSRSR
jgi:hypothetical protein